MRAKQERVCWGCQRDVETFVKVKRKVYYVKRYQCNPKCFQCLDIERIERKIADQLIQRSPWADFILGDIIGDYDLKYSAIIPKPGE